MFSLFKKRKNSEELENKYIEKEPENFEDVSNIATFFKAETGVDFDSQMGVLKSKVTSFCRHRDIANFDNCLSKVKSDAVLKQELIDYLTTNETYFYREFKQIESLVNHVKNDAAKVDILCAPCATGEEPYSIAIALLEAGISKEKFNIIGIDINLDAIKRANDATYGDRNVKNLSPEQIERYFIHNGAKYILKDSIKSLVTLKRVNIFESEFKALGKFDYIFSRNMLIYFDKETKIRAKKIFESMLKDDQKEIYFGHADLF
jgi:chemotaxis protein methyltransferase CheR